MGEIPVAPVCPYVRHVFHESHSLALGCKVGGEFHVQINILLRLIANKYPEGIMKRTLKRELKELAVAKQEANRIEGAWLDCSTLNRVCHGLKVQWFQLWLPALLL